MATSALVVLETQARMSADEHNSASPAAIHGHLNEPNIRVVDRHIRIVLRPKSRNKNVLKSKGQVRLLLEIDEGDFFADCPLISGA